MVVLLTAVLKGETKVVGIVKEIPVQKSYSGNIFVQGVSQSGGQKTYCIVFEHIGDSELCILAECQN